jgi:hypothetical protein
MTRGICTASPVVATIVCLCWVLPSTVICLYRFWNRCGGFSDASPFGFALSKIPTLAQKTRAKWGTHCVGNACEITSQGYPASGLCGASYVVCKGRCRSSVGIP